MVSETERSAYPGERGMNECKPVRVYSDLRFMLDDEITTH